MNETKTTEIGDGKIICSIAETKLELFKVLAIFGFLSAAMFAIGTPIVICTFDDKLDDSHKCLIWIAGIASGVIVLFVLICFCHIKHGISSIHVKTTH